MTQALVKCDGELLRQVASERNEAAFAELLSRHADWIFAASTRMVGDRQLAEDVSQAVFLLLWQRAAALSEPVLTAWLFKVTRYCASNALRSRGRRQKHERLAAEMKPTTTADAAESSSEMLSLLDSMVEKLRRKDRQAVLLRFYRGKSMREISVVMGISEEAARKRVYAAVNRLREKFAREGLTLTAPALEIALKPAANLRAPQGLISFQPAGASPRVAALAKGTKIMLWTAKLKAAVAAGLILLPVGAGTYLLAAGAGNPTPPANSSASPAFTAAPEPAGPPEAISQNAPVPDTAIFPFLNDNTGMLIAIDFDKVDVDAFQKRVLAIKSADPAQPNGGNDMIQHLHDVVEKFRQAGASRLYMMLVLHGAAQHRPVVIIPTEPGTDAAAVVNLLGRPADRPVETKLVHNAIVWSTDAKEIAQSEPQERNDLQDALAASNSPVRIVYVPAKFNGQQLPQDLQNIGVSPRFYSDPQWRKVKWFSFELGATPGDASHIIYQCDDRETAQAVEKILDEKMSAASGDAGNFFNIFKGATFTVADDRVVIALDNDSLDRVLIGPVFGRPDAAPQHH